MPPLTPENDAIRATRVSASEVGALLGPHPYSSPQRIWDRLCDPSYRPDPPSAEMLRGIYFEPYIGRYAAQHLGLRLRANRHTRVIRPRQDSLYQSCDHLCATPDYFVLRSKAERLIQPAMLVEVKLSSIIYGWSETQIGLHYEWQARAQLAVTERDVCIIAALVGSKFYTVPIARDMHQERMMLDAVNTFMHEHAIPMIRPPEIPQLRKLVAVVEEAGGARQQWG
jgi:predicted phage-related endonuclease